MYITCYHVDLCVSGVATPGPIRAQALVNF